MIKQKQKNCLPFNQGVSVAKGVVHDDICYMNDKCWPNPCQNGGICKQTSTDFQCECEGNIDPKSIIPSGKSSISGNQNQKLWDFFQQQT